AFQHLDKCPITRKETYYPLTFEEYKQLKEKSKETNEDGAFTLEHKEDAPDEDRFIDIFEGKQEQTFPLASRELDDIEDDSELSAGMNHLVASGLYTEENRQLLRGHPQHAERLAFAIMSLDGASLNDQDNRMFRQLLASQPQHAFELDRALSLQIRGGGKYAGQLAASCRPYSTCF
ncbi:hypothetical protein, partial [Piscirickettsia litoralis]|uniref:hypothetical protein n=1 Tax=Piscirickettsia litoralis TaxID=1891921 RepID=UPI001301896D